MNEFSYEEKHLGTDVILSFICQKQSLADAIAFDIFTQIHNIELEFSRFLPTSSLSQLNTKGSLKVSDLFIEVLQKAISLHTFTKGVFNPLVQVATLGYNHSFQELSKKNISTLSTNYNLDIQKIIINKKTHTVTLNQNQQLDFGGILKGYLANKLADYVVSTYQNCHGCIINLGGDLTTRGTDELHQIFTFRLYNPITGEEIALPLLNSSLATSGTYARNWHTKHGQKNHIVDPKYKDNPKKRLISASIIHSDGAVAEALTKLFIIKGISKAITLKPPHLHYYQYFCVDYTGKNYSSFL